MSDRPIVTVTREVPGVLDVPGAEVRLGGPDALVGDALHEFVSGSTAVVSMYHDRVDEAFLDAAGPQLRGVTNFAVGYENIDVSACAARGILVGNTPDAVTEGTANMAITLMLAAARRLVEADRFARTDAYRAGLPLGMNSLLGRDLTGRTLLIVGAGRIGLATAMRALAFGMRVEYVARSRHLEFELAPVAASRVELDEGLARADVVSLHTPLTEETRHLIDARRLGLMREHAILVNTARGPVVDEAALAQALRERRIFSAGLDVYEFEPRISEALLDLPNVVLSPHIGSAEVASRELMTQMVSENVSAMVRGERPPYEVRP